MMPVACKDELPEIHLALLQGDLTASERLVRVCLTDLRRLLTRRHIALPREAVADAAHDAVLAYLSHPERYSEERGDLLNYLIHIADNKMRDWLRAYQRRASRELSVGGALELGLWEAKHNTGAVDQRVDPDALAPEFEALIADILPDARDRRLLQLICGGRTPVEEFAAVLGIIDLPAEEMRAEVKRHRDRILKRVRRRRESFRSFGSQEGNRDAG
jgi:RNA polymerase sigma-70 factor, ECF subfamily